MRPNFLENPDAIAGATEEEVVTAMSHCLFAGNRLLAIKLYRVWKPQPLADAKEFVDRLEADLRDECPDQFLTPNSGNGWIPVAIAAAVMAALVAFWAMGLM